MTVRKRFRIGLGRSALPSPGRPSVARREDHRQFWAAIAADAARAHREMEGARPRHRLEGLRGQVQEERGTPETRRSSILNHVHFESRRL